MTRRSETQCSRIRGERFSSSIAGRGRLAITFLAVLLLTLGALSSFAPPSRAHRPPTGPARTAHACGASWTSAAEIEPLWRASRRIYVMAGGTSARVFANMLDIHANAAIAGHVGPSRHDDLSSRCGALTHYPAFVESSTTRADDDQWHVPGWLADPGHFPSDQHVARQSGRGQPAEAWEARRVIGLSRRRSRDPASIPSSPGRASPAGRASGWTSSTGTPTCTWPTRSSTAAVAPAQRLPASARQVPRRRPPLPRGRDLEPQRRAWPALPPQQPANSGANRVSTSEYDELIFDGTESYASALAAACRRCPGHSSRCSPRGRDARCTANGRTPASSAGTRARLRALAADRYWTRAVRARHAELGAHPLPARARVAR